MNSSVWRDVRSRNRGWSRSRDMIVGLRDGNRIWRVSPDRVRIAVLALISCFFNLQNCCNVAVLALRWVRQDQRWLYTWEWKDICILSPFTVPLALAMTVTVVTASLHSCLVLSGDIPSCMYPFIYPNISPSFYFAYINLLLFGYHLNLSCSQ